VHQPTPDLFLRTMFVFDRRGRIVATREPAPARNPGPLFTLIRSASATAWAIRADVPAELAAQLNDLAREEPPLRDRHDVPFHADRYVSLCGGQSNGGPAFSFPENIAQPRAAVLVSELKPLEQHFRGWIAVEIPERSPIRAVMEGGFAVSVCFCARNTAWAAEAGVETAPAFRGRGFAPRVTAAWALAIRASGRIPLYTTSWSNHESLAVARKLGLVHYASHWDLSRSP
jgi:RimJ/RimL family protein N-acetyltransferase